MMGQPRICQGRQVYDRKDLGFVFGTHKKARKEKRLRFLYLPHYSSLNPVWQKWSYLIQTVLLETAIQGSSKDKGGGFEHSSLRPVVMI